MKRTILLIIVLSLFADVAKADHHIRFNISVMSKHTDERPNATHTTDYVHNGVLTHSETVEIDTPEYNESNPGFGVEVPVTGSRYWVAGVYKNSYSNTSFYGGMGFELNKAKAVKFVLETFAVTGYDGGLKIGAAPGVRFNLFGKGVKINYIPFKSAGSGESDVITFQYQFEY